MEMLFKDVLALVREQAGFSQEQLAEKIGKTSGYVSKLERGLHAPSYQCLCDIIRTLGVDANLFFYPEKMQRVTASSMLDTLNSEQLCLLISNLRVCEATIESARKAKNTSNR